MRFWTWVNDGWVKLSLRPGEYAQSERYRAHDEGGTASGETWEADEHGVCLEAWSDGRDCDGRMETFTRLYCPADRLAVREVEIDGESHMLPDWERVEASQRDHSAEAAGY
jgi:hypothetical protein